MDALYAYAVYAPDAEAATPLDAERFTP